MIKKILANLTWLIVMTIGVWIAFGIMGSGIKLLPVYLNNFGLPSNFFESIIPSGFLLAIIFSPFIVMAKFNSWGTKLYKSILSLERQRAAGKGHANRNKQPFGGKVK